MAATIVDVNYVGIQLAQYTLNTIVIDLDGRITDASELLSFFTDQVYPNIINTVAAFTFGFNPLNSTFPDMFNPDITRTYVPQIEQWQAESGGVNRIGDPNGFELVRSQGWLQTVEILPGTGTTATIARRLSAALYYKGDLVFNGYSSTNDGQPQIIPVILYRDHETKKLITWENVIFTTVPALNSNQSWHDASDGQGLLPVLPIPEGLTVNDYLYSTYGTRMRSDEHDKEVDPDDITNEIPIGPAPDPYWNAPDSEPDSEPGTYDYSGNPPGGAGTDSDPSLSATDAGFITIFNPTTAELKSLASYLWSNSFDISIFKKLFNNPMDIFLGLSILPVSIPDGGRIEVGIGLIGTGVFMTKAATQWVTLDCGTVEIKNFNRSYLDYDPYTSVEIYLPFVGSRTLKADEVMGKTLHVTYKIDILSGACAAWVDAGDTNLYVFMGQCAMSVPVASGDWTNVINGVLSVVGGAAGGAVKGGASGAIAGGVAAASSIAVTDGKISVDRAGAISSAAGFRAPKKPYLVISSPNVCKPANQNVFEGYPLYVTYKLSKLSGFTQVELINLSNIPATGDELAEIKQLLLAGVIL